ncbi:reticulon domain protein, 22 kDa potentially aggravating protein (paple22) [Angomonas deanei]|uniref:Reticulon-like protein n=1 Tax=Angomonas deanei TaxID=59799 RepID=S9VK37_9TRYP|nr:reticulon domain protein, 22 kDa potentially aggravating protein (paple22) [Angomonas deanei]EPY41233.1 reticulon domain protein, 22 kDa potentially aggravating protein (paple22) [Angomonas deanei]EPY43622.1 reticulon domain protein, 22 kDa potentially aggravating protein (paple22) [Angomonas deanei]CAD2218012.1 Reticulon, putative [Angomonas deanei]|eukprot:EPY24412.1 reticulon domain protein, 22 kDa potentially aggravating protein (paple22) [Angomonas deanei]
MEAVKKTIQDVKKMKPYDLFSWKKPAVTGAVLGFILVLWWVFVYYQYTLTTFVSRLVALALLVGAVSAVTNRTVSELSTSQESVDMLYEKVRPYFLRAAEALFNLASWKNPTLSVKVLLTTYLTAFVGNYVSDTTVILLVILAVFGIPPVYEKKKAEADQILKQVQTYTDKYIGMLTTKGKEVAKKADEASKKKQ